METFTFVVGVVGNVVSVLMFLSPVPTFRRIIKNHSTEDFDSLPYACILVSAALWTYYGIIKPGAYLVAIINGFGVLVEIVFVTLFLIYAPPKVKATTGILVGLLDVGFLAAAVLFTMLALHGNERIDATGFLSSGLNMPMYASPLAAMKTVIRTKSVEFMPFLLTFVLFLNSCCWSLYAVLTSDYFLGVPNVIGIFIGIAQLLLYAKYMNSMPSENVSDGLEEGCLSDPLISSSSTGTFPGN